MPTFATGNAQWDQNLSTLGNALFPDPSKAGEAFYYGAKAREAQVDTSKKMDQLAAGHTALAMPFGTQPQPRFVTGPGGATIMQDPGAANAAPLPPPLMTPNVGPQVSGTAGSPPGPGFPPGTPQPVLPAGPPPAGPAVVAQTVATGVQAHDYAAPGTERTTTNGQTPQSGYPGALTGTFTGPDGGTKMAGPAAADGTPSPAAFNISQYMALQALSGLGADQMRATGTAMVANWVKNGQMTPRQADDILAGLGVPILRETNLREAGQTTRTGMEQAGQTTRTGMTIAGENYRAGMPLQAFTDPNDETKTTFVPLGQSQAPRTAMTPAAVAAAVQPVTTVDPNASGAAPRITTTGQAQRTGATPVAVNLEQQRAQLEQQYRRTQPGPEKTRLRQEIMALQPVQETDPQKQVQQRFANYQSDQDIYAVPQTGLTQKWGVTDPAAFKPEAQALIDRRAGQLQNDLERPELRGNPGAAHRAATRELINSGLLQSPAEVNAARVPVRQKIASLGTRGDPRIDVVAVPNAKGSGPAVPHMMVGLTQKGLDAAKALNIDVPNGPAAGAPVAGAPSPGPAAPAPGPVPGPAAPPPPPSAPTGATTATPAAARARAAAAGPPPPISSILPNSLATTAAQVGAPTTPTPGAPPVAPSLFGARPAPTAPAFSAAPAAPVQPAATAGSRPQGALGPAPPGVPDGTIGTTSTGMRGVARGGWIYPINAGGR